MSDDLPTKRIVTTTVMGVAGGAVMGASMTVGAKAGAAAGALAGPVGMIAGAAVGGVLGFSSYWVAKGISALVNDGEEVQGGDSGNGATSNQGDATEGQREPETQREEEEEDEDVEDDREDDEDEESSASEDESSEESTEVSDYEQQIESILNEIRALPSDAPVSLRLELYHRLCTAFTDLISNPTHRVHINREDRFLSITVPRHRPIEIPREVRENLGLATIIDRQGLRAITLNMDSPDRPVVYRIQCRHCRHNYVGKTRKPRNRYSQHKSRVNTRGRNALAAHLNRHRRQMGRDLRFEDSYDVIIIRELSKLIGNRVMRNWEVFLQWLFNGRDKDGGIGKR